jgi:hypothetical protein
MLSSSVVISCGRGNCINAEGQLYLFTLYTYYYYHHHHHINGKTAFFEPQSSLKDSARLVSNRPTGFHFFGLR